MNRLRIPIVACVLGVLLAMAATPARAESTKIKLATLAPKGSSFHQILQAMAEKWRKVHGGGVNLTLYTDGTMGSEADMVRRMRAGQIQAAMITVVGMGEIDNSVSALQNMPMMFRSLEEVDLVREKLRPLLEKRFEDKGFVVIFWGDAGWVRFFSRKPALMPDDIKRLKLFSWAGDTVATDLWRASGFQPVPLEPTDILTGLQTGLIEAVATTPTYALAGQFYGPASNMLDLHWAPLVGGAVVTKKAWDTIQPAARAELLKAAKEAGEQIQARSRTESTDAIEAMKKRGLKVQSLTPDAEAAWRACAEGVYPAIRGPIVPADLFDQVQQILKESRAAGKPAQP